MTSVSIQAAGMVTAVGLDAPSSCAAIRCAIDGFTETRFMDKGGDWIMGAQVPLEKPWRGLTKLVQLIVPAIQECLMAASPIPASSIPLLLCVSEKERPGRFGDIDSQLLKAVEAELATHFHHRSGTIARGRIGGALAVGAASELIHQEGVPFCIIAGVDSFLIAATVAAYEERGRLLTSQNSNGFIPGEAGGACLIGSVERSDQSSLLCCALGSGLESATIESEEPLRADGLVQAIRNTFADAQKTYEHVDYRLTDCNGEQYWFKEASLAMTRTLRIRKEQLDIWHPADCIGETGAAAVPCSLAVALFAERGRYSPGPGVLCHYGNDSGERIALLLGATR